MNKRARQLAVQAGFDLAAAERAFNGHILDNSLSRFYSSIMQECLTVCQQQFVGETELQASVHNSAVQKCIDELKKHFDYEQT